MCVPSPRPQAESPSLQRPLAPSPPPPALSPPGARTSPRVVCPHLATRQSAGAFNQPLTLDTSKVTTMAAMFYVRTLAPTTSREPFPAKAAAGSSLCAPLAPPPPHAPPVASRSLRTPPLKLGRAQTLCPTRPRSSPVAHGRATPRLTTPTVRSGAVWAHARPHPRRPRHRRRSPRHLLRTYAAARAAETRSVAAAPACATVSGTRCATRPPARPSCLVSGARSVRRCRPKKSRAELRLVVGA